MPFKLKIVSFFDIDEGDPSATLHTTKRTIVELKLRQGPVFNQSKPTEVLEFLRTRNRETFSVSPESLRIAVAGKEMTLQMTSGNVGEYPLRQSFFLKLLKWYSFPASAVMRLNGETVAAIMNDFLLAIKGETVNVIIEDKEALTITSDRYVDLSDLTIIKYCERLGIDAISRDDFVTRLYLKEKANTQPVPKDICGFGYNVFNSETGFRKVSVMHYILRYTCSNGAIVHIDEEAQDRVHYGIPPAQLEAFLKERIDHAEVSRKQVMQALAQLPKSKGNKIFESMKKSLAFIVGRPQLKDLQDQVSENSTAYDVFNLLTDYAKSLDVERRIRLEALAGNMLSLKLENQ